MISITKQNLGGSTHRKTRPFWARAGAGRLPFVPCRRLNDQGRAQQALPKGPHCIEPQYSVHPGMKQLEAHGVRTSGECGADRTIYTRVFRAPTRQQKMDLMLFFHQTTRMDEEWDGCLHCNVHVHGSCFMTGSVLSCNLHRAASRR